MQNTASLLIKCVTLPTFLQELLWNRGDVEVLEPVTLRKDMANMVKRMWDKYKNDKE